jgi:amino acid transporter
MSSKEQQAPTLKRSLSLPLLTFYGLGTMVGGGFYALMGEVIGMAGSTALLSFVAASLLAFLSALSFAELTARMPYSAGEARYVLEAFGSRRLALVVGLLVILTGVVSAATLSRAIAGFLIDFAALPVELYVVLTIVVLTLVATWGITESVVLATIITVIEVGGLIAIVVLRGEVWAELPERWTEFVRPPSELGWKGTFLGAFLTFYAFVGFEDMVNLAEEVENPRRNLPLAIVLALTLTTLLYVLVVITALLAVSPAELAASHTPLARLVAQEGELARSALGVISILAGVNGALVQIIMAARIVHGLGPREPSLRWLAHVHPKTRTPVRATVLIAVLVVALALFFPLVHLAVLTSSILLVVFAFVNLALWVIKGRSPAPAEGPSVPRWVPLAGFASCVVFLGFHLLESVSAG